MVRSKEQALLEIGYRKVWLRDLKRSYEVLRESGQLETARWLQDYFIEEAEAKHKSYVLFKPGKACDRILDMVRDLNNGFVPKDFKQV